MELGDPESANDGERNVSGNPLAFLGLKRIDAEDEQSIVDENKSSDLNAEGK